MAGTQVVGAFSYGTLPGSGNVRVHDMNRDGRAEIIVGDPLAGQMHLWSRANNDAITATSLLAANIVGIDVRGAGDFNGDGKGDILTRTSDGALGLLFTDGTAVISSAIIAAPSGGYFVQGVGDLTGDGVSDILVSRFNGPTNELRLWTMSNGVILADDLIRPLAAGELVQLVADFNGDGRSDLLMRSAGNGLSELLMDGKSISQTVPLFSVTSNTLVF